MTMTTFKIRIDDIIISVSSVHPDIQTFCESYLSDGEPSVMISSSSEDIQLERQLYLAEHKTDECPYSDVMLEFMSLHRKLARELLSYKVLLIHGSAISVDGNGYMFVSDSGVGKSTHVLKWKQFLGDRAIMINDDKPFIRITPNGPMICGSPWNGKENRGNNISIPFRKCVFLNRGTDNNAWRISQWEAYAGLLPHIFFPKDKDEAKTVLSLVDELLKDIEFFRLSCNLSDDAGMITFNKIQEEGSDK